MNGKKVVVIGGGPAGMMAAGIAGSRGLDVTLIEKNDRLGKKLRITGKGRCNITNNADIETLFENVISNKKFLYSAFYSFTNTDVIKFFNDLGVATKVERGERIFPVSDNAADVIEAMKKFLKQNKVKILNKEVEKVISKENEVKQVILNDKTTIECESVIIATGGLSYTGTGSTGDGYKFAKENGHTIVDIKPSLVPLETVENWIKELQGLSLKNVTVKILNRNNKNIFEDFGEMLFTHFGVSGPLILSASCYMKNATKDNYKIELDLKPALSEEQLDKRIQKDFEQYINKDFSNSLDDLLPKKLIPVIIRLSGISEHKKINQISKEERKILVDLIKHFKFTVKSFRSIEEAIITAGGVKTSEINPSTMESKLIKGLFFAGEVIDVDAYTGGFNLQIAFSTGYLAGINC